MDVYPLTNITIPLCSPITNTKMAAQIMAAQVAFRAALGRIGFSEEAQLAIVAQGFNTMSLLGLVTSDQITQVCKLIHKSPNNPVPINIVQQQLLLAMRYWVLPVNELVSLW